MSMTPGPWRYIAEHRGFVIEASDKCYDIAVVRYIGKEDNEANARAIAALPDLVEALNRVARLNPNAGEIGAGMLRTIVEEARAALNKAGVTHG